MSEAMLLQWMKTMVAMLTAVKASQAMSTLHLVAAGPVSTLQPLQQPQRVAPPATATLRRALRCAGL